MKQVLVGRDNLVGPWVTKRAGGTWVPGRGVTIGQLDDEKGLIGGCILEDYNGANISMHVAGTPGWLTREFLWFAFYYVFEQLGCKRATGIVPASNAVARKFDEGLGFVLEATLKDAHPDGDLLVYVMHKADCRWLNIKRNLAHGQRQRTTST